MRKAGVVRGTGLSRRMFSRLQTTAGLCASMFFLFATMGALACATIGAAAQPLAHLPTVTQLSAAADGDASRTTFTIKVLGGDSGIPTGTVTLSNGAASLGSVVLDESGSATYTAATAPGPDHAPAHITAIYEGDDTFGPSSSLAVPVAAASTVPTFTLSGAPTTLSVKAGNFVTSTVTITPTNGFDLPVLLSCSGLPANSTCAFNPANVTPNGTAPATTSASSTLTIQTLAATGSGTGSVRSQSPRTPIYAILLPGFAALAGLGLLRKRAFAAVRVCGFGLLLLGFGLGLSACSPRYSYFNHPPLTDPGTTLGTFTVLVNGSSANAGSVIIPPPVQVVLTVTK